MKKIEKYIDCGIRYFSYSALVIIIIILALAFVKGDTTGEANTGDFSCIDYNHNWNITVKDKQFRDITIPKKMNCKSGDVIYMTNVLPKELSNNMHLCLQTDLQDVEVYIDGKLRESYTTDGFDSMTYYLPSAYVFTKLNSEDSGKNIDVRFTVKKNSIIHEMVIGNGNNAWFKIIENRLPLTMLAIFVMTLAFVAIMLYLFIKRNVKINKSIFYLCLTMSTIGIWMLSESKLQQLILNKPSLCSYISYFSIEIVGPLVLMYFDNVQHKRFRKQYRILECIACGQVALNIILSITDVAPLTETLKFSHLDVLIGIAVVMINVIRDIKSGEIVKYKIVAGGMASFMLFSVGEICNYYASDIIGYGTFMCIGLLLLLFTTVIQIIFDALEQVKRHEKQQQESWINTIETIASTIDAKDEYTGGHSNRVSEYAGALARGMMEEYNFTEEDIVRICYIGLMHDIGKIGVADTILNKSGRLTDEEFTLMKKHVEIGDSLLNSMKNSMEGLVDGIRHHHERYDGKGYPSGLKGAEIPLIARILCIADCYDAMTSNRVYRKRLSDEAVKEELKRCAGTQFDPALVSIFVDLIDKGEISPITIDGMEVDESGKVRKSSVLEYRLQNDMKENEVAIHNPSHIRMACYIMKLAEYNNQEFKGYIVELRNREKGKIEYLLKEYIQSRDINIAYNDNKNLVVFFGRTKEELADIYSKLESTIIFEEL